MFSNTKEKEYLIENLAMLLSSGMNISMAIEAIRSEMHSPSMKILVDNLGKEILSGQPIWKSLTTLKMFPPQVIALIKVGEESGRLQENLKLVIDQQQKDRTFKSKIRSAMLYPMLVFIITVVVGLGVAWFILPRLATVFSSLKIELPLITKILIAFGKFLNQYGIIAVPLTILSNVFKLSIHYQNYVGLQT